jgi:CBS domain-containing protein
MARTDVHLDAMLRHLGAAYYESTQGRATRSDVTRALDTVAEHLNEPPSHTAAGRSPSAGRAAHPAHDRHSRRWARQVQDVMTTSVVTVDRITPYKEIARLLAVHKISGVPVLTMGRHVAGVVTEADLVAVEDQAAQRARYRNRTRGSWPFRRHEHPAVTAGELMTAPAVTIHPYSPIPSAARVMHTQHLRMLPVVDADGTLVGVVSRRDLLDVFLRPDDDIAEDVRQVLDEVFGDDGKGVAIKVRNGIVTVIGTYEVPAGKHADLTSVADRLIWGVDGVVDVVDKLGQSAA